MIIQAELKCKQAGCEAEPCAVDKVIELPSSRFKQFSRTLLADYDFIAENKDAIQRDEDARHCLLILDAEGTDGFLSFFVRKRTETEVRTGSNTQRPNFQFMIRRATLITKK